MQNTETLKKRKPRTYALSLVIFVAILAIVLFYSRDRKITPQEHQQINEKISVLIDTPEERQRKEYSDSKDDSAIYEKYDNEDDNKPACKDYIEADGKKLCYISDFHFVITAGDVEKIKKEAYKELLNSFKLEIERGEFNFSDSEVDQVIFLQSTHPDFYGEYAISFKNKNGELTALMGTRIVAKEKEEEYITFLHINPLAPAKVNRDETDVNAINNYPPLNEDQAFSKLDLHLRYIESEAKTVEFLGYATVYAYYPSTDWYYTISDTVPYYEYLVDGEYKWVRSTDGEVFDEKRLKWIAEGNIKNHDNPMAAYSKREYDPNTYNPED